MMVGTIAQRTARMNGSRVARHTRRSGAPSARLAARFALAYFVAALCSLASLAACSGDSTGPQTAKVATVEISQPQLTMGVGTTTALQAVVRDGSGRVLTDRVLAWTSSDNSVATVSSTGVITALRTGAVQIAATVEGRSAVANVTIAPKVVASVQVLPGEIRTLVGASVQLSAQTLDDNGAPLSDRRVMWSSSDATIAVVDTTGRVTGIAPGVASITATSESRSVSIGVIVTQVPVARIDVSPPTDTIVVGQSTQLSAVMRDSVGGLLGQRAASWATSDVTVATVSSSGLVVGVSPGTATITVASDGRTADVRIVVRPRPVGSVIVSPGEASLTIGQQVRLTVQLTDDNGMLLTGRPVEFRSENSAIASVAADGTVIGITPGSTVIVATSEGLSGRMNVTVSALPVASVVVTPPDADLVVGETIALNAEAIAADGSRLAGRVVSWTSGAPSVATVSADGLVRAIGPGAAVIMATIEGRNTTVNVTVRAVPVGRVSVTPGSATIIVGDALDFTAEVRDADGTIRTDKSVLWASSDERIAVVSSAGRVRTLAVGTVTISATADGISGSSSIVVRVEPVISITVEPPTLSIDLPSGSAQILATPRGRNGGALTGRTITYQSSDPSIATVSATGRVTAVRQGTTSILVSSEGRLVVVPVTVNAAPVATISVSLSSSSVVAGESATATAVLRDVLSNVLIGRTVAWTSSNPAVATISASGTITTLATGTTTITATSEGKTGTATLTVTPKPVATVAVSLAATSIPEGSTTQASAVTRDASGAVLTGRTIAWSSSNPSVATVSATGVVTAVNPGSANIIATSEGKTGSAALTVTALPVNTVSVTLADASILTGATTTATAILKDVNGRTLTGRAVTWSSSNDQVATVSASGVVTARSSGTATITATSEGKSGSAGITVTTPLAPVATVTLTLASGSIAPGATTQATVVLKDANGSVLTARTVTFTSLDPSIATVSPSGLVTAIKAGNTTITATSEGRSGAATLQVIAPVASVTVNLASSSIQSLTTTQASAVLRDVDGNVLTGRAVTWTSSAPLIATVSASGVVTGVAPGVATITATSEGKSGGASVTVTLAPPPPVSTVSVSLASSSIQDGATTQATATTRDAGGNTLNGRTITWSSSNTSVATVSASGLVTAVNPGTASIIATSEGKTGSATLTVTAARPVPVATVSVSLASSSIVDGATTQATAVARDANGVVLTGRSVTWSSSNTSVATVSASGLVTAVNPGTANIIATSEGKSGSASLTVTAIPVATVAVTLGNSSIVDGSSTQATAVTRDANGNVLTGRTVTWSSSNTNVATVSASGLVTAVNPGSATITATSETKTGSAALTVTAPPPTPVATVAVTLGSSSIVDGATTQATAVTRDANGSVLTGRTVTWSSSNTSVATVSATGLVTAVNPGTATITATSETKTGSASLTVTAVPVATVSVSLASSSIVDGATTQATAVTRDANGNVLTGRAVTWSSSNTNVATVSSSGLVTAVNPGSATITATSETKTGSAALTVTAPPPAPVATVSVSLASSSIVDGATTQATAVTRDANGTMLTGRTVTWSSSNTNVATVSASGVVTAVNPGTASITATSEGKSGSASLTVTAPPPAPVATVSVTLANSSIVDGATTQATAVTRDANGNVLTGRTVTWSSSNTNVATVSAAGVVTAVNPGTASIIATSETKTGSATVTVTAPPPAPVSTISVSLASSSVVEGGTTQATAVLRDANGNVLTGRTVTWSTSNSNVATVSASGVVTTVAPGTVNISATSEGKTGSAQLTVTQAAVARIVVTPSTATIDVNGPMSGRRVQLTATLYDANDRVLTGRTVTWTSSNNGDAIVTSTGLVSSVSEGVVTITASSGGKSGTARITVTR